MNYELLASSYFEKEIKGLASKFTSLKTDIGELFSLLKEDPFQGISLGNDCYKIRLAIKSKGKGKSGGARVITCVKVINQRVYLLSIYDKSEKEDITQKSYHQF